MNTTTNKGQTMKTVTGYKAAAMLNAKLASLGLPATVPPQMLYNYIRDGRIPSVVVDGQRVLTRRQALAWIRKHVKGSQARAAEARAAEVA
jgi:hypothetical protein